MILALTLILLITLRLNTKKILLLFFLNINSIFNKVRELDDVLKKCDPDAFLINESKLDSSVPTSWYINKKYKILRLDREDKGGGGELVF
jgi:exonuclease III